MVRLHEREAARTLCGTRSRDQSAHGGLRSDAAGFRKVGRRKNIRSALRDALPEGAGAAGETESRGRFARGRLRIDHQWPGDFAGLLGAKRSYNATAAVTGASRRRDSEARRRISARARTRHAVSGRIRSRGRSADDAADRRGVDPRCDSVSVAETEEVDVSSRVAQTARNLATASRINVLTQRVT